MEFIPRYIEKLSCHLMENKIERQMQGLKRITKMEKKGKEKKKAGGHHR